LVILHVQGLGQGNTLVPITDGANPLPQLPREVTSPQPHPRACRRKDPRQRPQGGACPDGPPPVTAVRRRAGGEREEDLRYSAVSIDTSERDGGARDDIVEGQRTGRPGQLLIALIDSRQRNKRIGPDSLGPPQRSQLGLSQPSVRQRVGRPPLRQQCLSSVAQPPAKRLCVAAPGGVADGVGRTQRRSEIGLQEAADTEDRLKLLASAAEPDLCRQLESSD